ncbi:4'-phosphopantetheinyl transferase family protein [Legionella clemsonensis]|uniref:4'-phosphopantetheinyl transferase sfp n=1 Tax=Legionella clemsonensis TaxID=1867846 RepID=A0A222P3H5_9GAMM|nr:4'-phosphopantetheinyl transferase superfamily protein [Legionella clemsonensis]ASQ46396.1 4'-phosphopantetheinyl transferase sfp [Legionella clemsonensis]
MSLFLPMTADDCSLRQDRIDIWEFSLENLPDWAMSIIDEEERHRAQRFHFPHHQRRFAVSHAMLRAILGRYLKHPPSELLFTYGSHGKPSVKSLCNLEFNLTHSGELALLAIGQQFPLGIDIEFFSARPYLGLAKTVFSALEVAQLSALPPWMQPLGFFHVWSQKEALIKACGLGLSYPTKNFEVTVIPPAKTSVEDILHRKNWQMISFMPKIRCNAALCCDINIQHIRYICVHPLEFFN